MHINGTMPLRFRMLYRFMLSPNLYVAEVKYLEHYIAIYWEYYSSLSSPGKYECIVLTSEGFKPLVERKGPKWTGK